MVGSTQFSDYFTNENNAGGIKAKCNAAVQQWNKEVNTEIKMHSHCSLLACLSSFLKHLSKLLSARNINKEAFVRRKMD